MNVLELSRQPTEDEAIFLLKGILLNQLHQKFDGHPFEEETHCIDSLNNMYPGMVNEQVRCSPLFILASACLALIIGYVVQ